MRTSLHSVSRNWHIIKDHIYILFRRASKTDSQIIRVQCGNLNSPSVSPSSSLTPQEAVITGLLPETSYSVTVAAYTTKGDGARSKAKVVTTTGAGVCGID